MKGTLKMLAISIKWASASWDGRLQRKPCSFPARPNISLAVSQQRIEQLGGKKGTEVRAGALLQCTWTYFRGAATNKVQMCCEGEAPLGRN